MWRQHTEEKIDNLIRLGADKGHVGERIPDVTVLGHVLIVLFLHTKQRNTHALGNKTKSQSRPTWEAEAIVIHR